MENSRRAKIKKLLGDEAKSSANGKSIEGSSKMLTAIKTIREKLHEMTDKYI